MTPSLARSLLAALALAMGALAAAPAPAYPVAAQIDEQIKPNFGILLHPPAFRHHYHQGVWYGRRRGWGRGYIESYGRPYGERSGGALLKVRDAVVCGYRVGVGLERGGRADIRRSRICRASYGVMSEGANLEIAESAIGGERFGVYVASGDAKVDHNRIFDLPDPGAGVYAERPAGIVDDTNWLYVRSGCERFRWDGRRFCRREDELPPFVTDERDFDRDYADAWDVDGYDQGYNRDGPVVAFSPEPPRRCGLFGCEDRGRGGRGDRGGPPRGGYGRP